MIKFEKINVARPIRFDWRGLTKLNKRKEDIIIDNQEKDKNDSSNAEKNLMSLENVQEFEYQDTVNKSFLNKLKNVFTKRTQ